MLEECKIKELKEKVTKINEKERIEEYASALYQLSNDIEPWNNNLGGFLVWEVEKYPLEVNEVLHWMHTEDPTLRKKAISLMGEICYENSARLTLVDFPIDVIADFRASREIDISFPEKMNQILDQKYPGLRNKIYDILDPLSDDISYSFGYTYGNDHIDIQNGQTIECLVLHLESLDSTTLKYVVELLKNSFKIMNY